MQATDGLAGSLCSISGGSVSGYNMTACQDGLVCAPLRSSKLVGTGIGFCNLTSPDQTVSFFYPDCSPSLLSLLANCLKQQAWSAKARTSSGTCP